MENATKNAPLLLPTEDGPIIIVWRNVLTLLKLMTLSICTSMMALTKPATTFVPLECTETHNQKVVSQNVPQFPVRLIMLCMEHLQKVSFANKFAVQQSMLLQELDNVFLHAQQDSTSTPRTTVMEKACKNFAKIRAV